MQSIYNDFQIEKDYLKKVEAWHVINSTLKGDSSLREAKDLIIEWGEYSGKDFGWRAENVIAKGAKFHGDYAFALANKIKAVECTFDSSYAMYNTNYALVVDCDVSGNYLLKDSNNSIVIGKSVNSKGAFEGANNLLCYCENISQINSPKLGYIVAEYIDEVINPGNAKIYAVDVGKGKEFVTIIKKKDLDKNVTYRNIEYKIKSILNDYDDVKNSDDKKSYHVNSPLLSILYKKKIENMDLNCKNYWAEEEIKFEQKEKEKEQRKLDSIVEGYNYLKEEMILYRKGDNVLNLNYIKKEYKMCKKLVEYIKKFKEVLSEKVTDNYITSNIDYTINKIKKEVSKSIKEKIQGIGIIVAGIGIMGYIGYYALNNPDYFEPGYVIAKNELKLAQIAYQEGRKEDAVKDINTLLMYNKNFGPDNPYYNEVTNLLHKLGYKLKNEP